MSDFLYYLAAFAVVIGVLVVVHEYGHYAVARLCGVKVLRFSVGFGRAIWLRRFGADQTEWAIGLFPLGGYVKMLDEREAPVAAHELHRAFNRQSVWRRIAIVAAGPLANFLLAIVVYWGVFWHGTEELRPVLGTPPAATAAAAAGVENGERVVKVAGEAVQTWEDVRWRLLQLASDDNDALLEVINERHEIAVRRLDLAAIREAGWEGDAFQRLGLTYFRPQLPPVIGRVLGGSAGERAGLQAGDVFLEIEGEKIATWADVVRIVRAAPGKSLQVLLVRGESELALTAVPDLQEERGRRLGRLGISVQETGQRRDDLTVVVAYGPVDAFGRALHETWEKSVFSLVMLGKMVTGEVSWRNLSGPVTIADYAGQSAKLGIEYYLKFMALVSISLGVLNLLPIPILDGGHLMYYVVEIIKRGPLSERSMEIGQQIGLALLLMLMAFAFYNDINRLISG
ncbi:RIP metalloprotease RseP [Azospira restricta]|uniref:Zinc metalloprotease n=1 Tax=Azospira restricta TaxID=404405 RepID=A0A974PWD2_9RHOO|nr:RIP metalloprotease RseP [Azospira restricta]QRJ62713.1 RIP metalloprotease RseP [Azospira restricta]